MASPARRGADYDLAIHGFIHAAARHHFPPAIADRHLRQQTGGTITGRKTFTKIEQIYFFRHYPKVNNNPTLIQYFTICQTKLNGVPLDWRRIAQCGVVRAKFRILGAAIQPLKSTRKHPGKSMAVKSGSDLFLVIEIALTMPLLMLGNTQNNMVSNNNVLKS